MLARLSKRALDISVVLSDWAFTQEPAQARSLRCSGKKMKKEAGLISNVKFFTGEVSDRSKLANAALRHRYLKHCFLGCLKPEK